MDELYKKYRPTTLQQVVGQDAIVNQLTRFFETKKLPHALLISGPSGCGKTTLARIIASQLKCSLADYVEVNCADKRGIDDMRTLTQGMQLRPLHGETRVYMLDEVHQLTGFSQNTLLKPLEDTPKHVYFILATTNPASIIPTIKNRTTRLEVQPIDSGAIGQLLRRVAKAEGYGLTKEVGKAIVKACQNSGRRSLVLLEQAMKCDSPATALAAIANEEAETFAIDLARCLVDQSKNWKYASEVIRKLASQPVEEIRRSVMGYANAILLSQATNKHARAYIVIDSFSKIRFDAPMAEVAARAYEVYFAE